MFSFFLLNRIQDNPIIVVAYALLNLRNHKAYPSAVKGFIYLFDYCLFVCLFFG